MSYKYGDQLKQKTREQQIPLELRELNRLYKLLVVYNDDNGMPLVASYEKNQFSCEFFTSNNSPLRSARGVEDMIQFLKGMFVCRSRECILRIEEGEIEVESNRYGQRIPAELFVLIPRFTRSLNPIRLNKPCGTTFGIPVFKPDRSEISTYVSLEDLVLKQDKRIIMDQNATMFIPDHLVRPYTFYIPDDRKPLLLGENGLEFFTALVDVFGSRRDANHPANFHSSPSSSSTSSSTATSRHTNTQKKVDVRPLTIVPPRKHNSFASTSEIRPSKQFEKPSLPPHKRQPKVIVTNGSNSAKAQKVASKEPHRFRVSKVTKPLRMRLDEPLDQDKATHQNQSIAFHDGDESEEDTKQEYDHPICPTCHQAASLCDGCDFQGDEEEDNERYLDDSDPRRSQSGSDNE